MKKITALLIATLLMLSLCLPASAAGYSVILSPQYNMAEAFESSVTKVSKDTRWALANTSGNAITSYSWEAMGDITSSYIPAKKDGKWGYITPSGNTIIPYNYELAGCFQNGVAMVKKTDGSFAYIDIYGTELFASPFTYSFSPSGGAICGMINGLYGYCDTEGTIIIHPQFDMAYDFHEGYAAVKFGGKWGYITTYGKYSVRPAYDYASDFKNGHAICRKGAKYGLINTTGKVTAAFSFDYIGQPDTNGRYPAKVGETSGYINANGEWILKTAYDYCYTFTNGVGRIYNDGLWGYINEAGDVLVPPTFVDCGEYHNDRAPYSADGILWGYLTLDLTPPVAKPETKEPTPAAPSTTPVITPPNSGDDAPGTNPQTQNPATDASRPLEPLGEDCISMRINSKIALANATEFTLAEAPALINGTTMIPVRSVVELLGGTVSWDEKTKRIVLKRNYISVSVSVGSKICYINGAPGYLSAAPVMVNGSTLVPLRSITDALGCSVEWNGTYQNIYIYY